MHMRDELASMTKLACVHSPVTSHRYCQMGDAIIMEKLINFDPSLGHVEIAATGGGWPLHTTYPLSSEFSKSAATW